MNEHLDGAPRAGRLSIFEATYAFLFSVADRRQSVLKSPSLNALVSVSFFLFVNTLTLGGAIVLFLPAWRVWFVRVPGVFVGAVAFAILALNFLHFGRKSIHDGIMKEYVAAEGGRTGRRYNAVAWAHIVCSLAALGIVAYCLRLPPA